MSREQEHNIQIQRNSKPPCFDGTTNLGDFLIEFEMAGWNMGTMALELVTCLRGSAVKILSDLESHERTHYPSLKRALCDRYDAENQCQIFKAQLKGRVRKNNESLSELAHDISKLVRKAYIELTPKMKDTIAKDTFIETLSDRELELAVFQGNTKSLQDAVKGAIEYEAFRSTRQRKSLGSVREYVSQTSDDSSDQGFQNRIAELEKQMETLRVAKFGGVNKPGKSETIVGKGPKRCFGCNEVGHFITNCPEKTTGKTVIDQTKAIECDFCGKLGHSMRVCWKYRGEQKGGVQICAFCGETGHFMIDCPVYRAHTKGASKKGLKGEKLM